MLSAEQKTTRVIKESNGGHGNNEYLL
jgi:hypothetical protein